MAGQCYQSLWRLGLQRAMKINERSARPVTRESAARNFGFTGLPPEDSALEVALLPQGELRVIETDWGHSAGGPDRNRSATAFIESALTELLNR